MLPSVEVGEDDAVGFLLFVIVNILLFIRPGEVVHSFEGLPLYNYAILACLTLSLTQVLRQFALPALLGRPVTLCVLGVLAAVFLSHVVRFSLYDAKASTVEFAKVVLYYLLLVGLVDSPRRLRILLIWLVGLVLALSLLALAQYHELINIPALEALKRADGIGEEEEDFSWFFQLQSTGMFNDPNDLSMILVIGMVLGLYLFQDRTQGLFRFIWLPTLMAFGYALMLTRSRGGFLAMIVGLVTLMTSRLGLKKSIPLALVVLPVLFGVFGGRSTNISVGDDTAQSRLQLWTEGLQLFRTSPVFGIGQGIYAEEAGLVAHNSYLHTLTELGLFGGGCFIGAFYCAALLLYRLGKRADEVLDPEMSRLRPYLLSMLAGYGTGMFSLSRAYVVPTYLVLGLVTAYQGVMERPAEEPVLRFGLSLAGRLIALSVAVLVFLYLFTRLFAHFG